jgi:acyl-CoA-binding protein
VEASFGDETRLILYALESQAERGPCEPRSKWGMSAEDRAKHETWVNLGKMEPFEAMRLFVKLMDEERPGWWKDDHANPSQNQQDKNAAGDASGARVVASPVRAVTRLNTHTSDTRDDHEGRRIN